MSEHDELFDENGKPIIHEDDYVDHLCDVEFDSAVAELAQLSDEEIRALGGTPLHEFPPDNGVIIAQQHAEGQVE